MHKYIVRTILILFLSNITFAKPISIGSKNFTEQLILGEMISLLLEENGFEVERKLNLGGSQFTFEAVKSGEIDIYPEYTGTGFINILKLEPESNPDIVYQKVLREFKQRHQLKWFKPYGFNNTYALATKKNHPQLGKMTKFSEYLPFASGLRIGAPHEFFKRKDGMPGLESFYGFKLYEDNKVGIDPGLMYEALKNNNIDLITAFTTDGKLKAYNLNILEDDRGFFPPYYAATIARMDTLRRYPRLNGVLQILEGLISESQMINLNYEVDYKKKSYQEVAAIFLNSKGLIKKIDREVRKQNYIFIKIKEHLTLFFLGLGLALLFGLPLALLIHRFKKIQNIAFAIINMLQTIPSLAVLGLLIPVLGIGYLPAVMTLFIYALLPIVRNSFLGLKGIDSFYIETAQCMGLTRKQILYKIEIPMALPYILGGVRTSATILIGTATLAALIGAGGLGDPIFTGISTVNTDLVLLGAVPIVIMAITIDFLFAFFEKKISSKIGINNT